MYNNELQELDYFLNSLPDPKDEDSNSIWGKNETLKQIKDAITKAELNFQLGVNEKDQEILNKALFHIFFFATHTSREEARAAAYNLFEYIINSLEKHSIPIKPNETHLFYAISSQNSEDLHGLIGKFIDHMNKIDAEFIPYAQNSRLIQLVIKEKYWDLAEKIVLKSTSSIIVNNLQESFEWDDDGPLKPLANQLIEHKKYHLLKLILEKNHYQIDLNAKYTDDLTIVDQMILDKQEELILAVLLNSNPPCKISIENITAIEHIFKYCADHNYNQQLLQIKNSYSKEEINSLTSAISNKRSQANSNYDSGQTPFKKRKSDTPNPEQTPPGPLK